MNTYLVRTFAFCFILASAQARPLALVGGRLIDGFGGPPLANSVIIIEDERITAIGTVGDASSADGCRSDFHRRHGCATRDCGIAMSTP